MLRWRYIFWVNIVAQMLALIVFLIWGSGEIQDWNNPKEKIAVDDKRKEIPADIKA